MEQAEKLAADLEKLRKNKERIPLDVLKTRYKTAYEQLTGDIKAEAVAVLKPIATRPPEWLKDCRIKAAYIEEIAAAFNSMYEAGSYAKKIGAALYKRYSLQEAEQIAREINGKYLQELTKRPAFIPRPKIGIRITQLPPGYTTILWINSGRKKPASG